MGSSLHLFIFTVSLLGVCHWVFAGAPIPARLITASQEMPPKYGADKAADGKPETHWAAANVPPVWVQANFGAPVWMSRLRLRQCEQTSIYDNARRISVSFSDASNFCCVLADHWEDQVISFPRRRAAWVRITIESTYKTSHYVGVGELKVEDEGPAAQERRGVEVTPPAPLQQLAQAGGGLPVKNAAVNDRGNQLIAKLSLSADRPRPHASLWINVEDVARAKKNILRHEWARRVFARILDGADKWVAMSDEQLRAIMPLKGAMFDNKAACPLCGGSCTASLERIGRVSCAKCAKSFPDEAHPDNGQGWKDPKTGQTTYFVGFYNSYVVDRVTDSMGDLSHAYILTGDERYARALSVLLDALAVIYPTCDKGPVWYPGVGGRLNRPFYQTARTLIYYAREYDLTYDSPEWDKPSCDPAAGTRRTNYENNLLKNGAEYCFGEVIKQKSPGLHNGNCDYLQGALAVGRVLGIQKYIDYVLESDLSIYNFIENTIDRDGQYYETSFAYSRHATDLFGHHAEMLRNYRGEKYPNGINLYEHPKLRLNYLRADSDVECAGRQPQLGDAGPDLFVADEERSERFSNTIYERLEILTARTTDPALKRETQRLLYEYCDGEVEKRRAASNFGVWLLFNAEEVPPPVEERTVESGYPTRCTLLAGARGIALLRSGSSPDTERCALLRYGATLNHGSPDEMNMNLYALGREITYDQGYGWAHHRCSWAHSTVAHNLVVVNEKNQLQGKDGSGGNLEHFVESSSVRVIAADDPACYGAEGVNRYRRLLALVDLSAEKSYFLDIFDVRGGQKHDLSHHFIGEMSHVEGITLSPPQTKGSLAGPQIEWWRFVQPSGWIAGQNKPFYWNAPPGNGFGFLYDVQRGDLKDGPPRFIWTLGERERFRPAHVFNPAQFVSDSSGGEARPLSVGSFFYRSEKPGDFIAFRVGVNIEGDYVPLVKFYRSSHYGIVALKVDGKSVGEPYNAYSPVGYFADWYAFGRVHLGPGVHELRFECVGKDPESEGYYFSLKAFAFESPDFLDKVGQKQKEGVALTVLPPRNSELVVAKAKGLGHAPVSSYVLTRRTGEALESRFVSLIEPFSGDMLCTELRSISGSESRPEGVKITLADGRADYFFDLSMSSAQRLDFRDGQTAIQFQGTLGAVRTRGGKPFEVLLANATKLRFGDLELAAEKPIYTGKVVAIDYEKSVVTLDTSLPESIGGQRWLVYFNRESYSRNAPYFIAGVRRAASGTQVDLGDASLILGRGRINSDLSSEGVFANAVPLDRERAWGRALRTRYFDGKAIRNARTGELGRIKHVELDSSVVIETNPGLRNGDRFDLLDIQVDDSFTVPAVIALWQGGADEWVLRSNVKVRMTLPQGVWAFDPASGATTWRLKPGTKG